MPLYIPWQSGKAREETRLLDQAVLHVCMYMYMYVPCINVSYCTEYDTCEYIRC